MEVAFNVDSSVIATFKAKATHCTPVCVTVEPLHVEVGTFCDEISDLYSLN